MPLTSEGSKVLDNMRKEYGSSKGESVFYATANKRGYGKGKWHSGSKKKSSGRGKT